MSFNMPRCARPCPAARGHDGRRSSSAATPCDLSRTTAGGARRRDRRQPAGRAGRDGPPPRGGRQAGAGQAGPDQRGQRGRVTAPGDRPRVDPRRRPAARGRQRASPIERSPSSTAIHSGTQRYGEPRATRHGRQDGNHHVSYLAEALRAHDSVVMERYARWLRQLLTTRGMCTRHIAECFDCLGRAINERGWADAGPALDVLATATAALRYDGGPARAVQDRAGAIAGGDPELETLTSYLADAIALARPDVLADHVAWCVGFPRAAGPAAEHRRGAHREIARRGAPRAARIPGRPPVCARCRRRSRARAPVARITYVTCTDNGRGRT